MVSSAISTKSRSRMRFTTFVGSAAAGLKGPLLVKVGDGPREAPVAGPAAAPEVEAAAARKSRPEDPGSEEVRQGEKALPLCGRPPNTRNSVRSPGPDQ